MHFRCPSTQLVWKICPINWSSLEYIVDFAGRWNDLFTNVKNYPHSIEMIKLSISIIWKIWKAGNSKSFNREIVYPKDIVNKALCIFMSMKVI